MLNHCLRLTVIVGLLSVGIMGCSKQSTQEVQLDLNAQEPNAEKTELMAKGDDQRAASGADATELAVGSPAPALSLAKFVQGESFDRFEPGHVYVVEFWATWCGPCRVGMPHITSLQEQYEGKVTFVGVTREDESTVETFLAKEQNAETQETWGDVVRYALALDDNDETNRAYMEAANQNGIPCAFIVGPDAHIEWIGHPGAIDGPLEQIASGNWDREAYVKQFEEEKRKKEVMMAALQSIRAAQQAEDWEKALASVDELLGLEEEQPLGLMNYRLTMLLKAEKFDQVVPYAQEILKDQEDARLFNAVAWTLATEHETPSKEILETALGTAQRAVELQKDVNLRANALDTLARVHYEMGNLNEAIASQEEAVAANPENESLQETLQNYLEERGGEDAVGQENPSDEEAVN